MKKRIKKTCSVRVTMSTYLTLKKLRKETKMSYAELINWALRLYESRLNSPRIETYREPY